MFFHFESNKKKKKNIDNEYISLELKNSGKNTTTNPDNMWVAFLDHLDFSFIIFCNRSMPKNIIVNIDKKIIKFFINYF